MVHTLGVRPFLKAGVPLPGPLYFLCQILGREAIYRSYKIVNGELQ